MSHAPTDEYEWIGLRASLTLVGLVALGLVPAAVVVLTIGTERPWAILIATWFALVPGWIYTRRHPHWAD